MHGVVTPKAFLTLKLCSWINNNKKTSTYAHHVFLKQTEKSNEQYYFTNIITVQVRVQNCFKRKPILIQACSGKPDQFTCWRTENNRISISMVRVLPLLLPSSPSSRYYAFCSPPSEEKNSKNVWFLPLFFPFWSQFYCLYITLQKPSGRQKYFFLAHQGTFPPIQTLGSFLQANEIAFCRETRNRSYKGQGGGAGTFMLRNGFFWHLKIRDPPHSGLWGVVL